MGLIGKTIVSYGVAMRMGKAAVAAFALWSGAALAEQADLVAFGDSLTQGYGLIESDGFVPQLRNYLKDQGVEARVVNAGVSGDTTAGGAARVGWTLTPEIDGMIVALGGNDLLRGIDPAVTRSNLKTILETAEARGVEVLLVGMQAPGNYGPGYKAAFDAIYPELAETYGTLYIDSFFKGLGGEDPARMKQYFQPDGIHPNGAGVQKIVAAIGPEVLRLIQRIEAR